MWLVITGNSFVVSTAKYWQFVPKLDNQFSQSREIHKYQDITSLVLAHTKILNEKTWKHKNVGILLWKPPEIEFENTNKHTQYWIKFCQLKSKLTAFYTGAEQDIGLCGAEDLFTHNVLIKECWEE